MSRSGYVDDCDYDNIWGHICYRGAVNSAMRGRRGQVFFKELLAALDAMPVKRLITDELEHDGEFCALGALGHAKGIDMTDINPECALTVGETFNIAESLAREVVYENDEAGAYWRETPEKRWQRMRGWAASKIKEPPQ